MVSPVIVWSDVLSTGRSRYGFVVAAGIDLFYCRAAITGYASMMAPTPRRPTLADVRDAARRIAPYVSATPLLRLRIPDGPEDVYLKLENLQPIGVYKVRSIGNAVLAADPDALRNGVYTASSGNAGIGLAWIARELGIRATVYVPAFGPPAKIRRIRELGATVSMLSDADWWEVIQRAAHPTDPGLYIDAVRDESALAGNGTLALEVLEQLPSLRTVLVPFGGGGVACGIASAARQLRPDTRVVVAESTASTPVSAALQAGEPVTVPFAESFISGAGAPSVLHGMWPVVRELIGQTVVSPLAEVERAVALLFDHHKVVVEGAGAIPVAAALRARDLPTPVVCIVTGGNIEWPVMAAILARHRRRPMPASGPT